MATSTPSGGHSGSAACCWTSQTPAAKQRMDTRIDPIQPEGAAQLKSMLEP
jgi:hypothetical protein